MTTYQSRGSNQGGSPSAGSPVVKRKINYPPTGVRPQMMWVDKTLLRIDTKNYQREEVSKAKTLDLIHNFRWSAFGALYVAKRPDGSLQVFEGGNRLRAALRRTDITEVPCLIYEIGKLSDEAKNFKTVNENRSTVGAYDRWKAGIIAKNENDLKAKHILDYYGILATKNPAKRMNQFNAIGCLVWLVRCWPDYAYDVFNACVLIHKPEDKPIKDKVMRGLCWLQRNGIDVCNPKGVLLKRLVDAGVPVIDKSIRSAIALLDSGGEKSAGKGILNVINKGKRNKIAMPNIDDE